MKARATKGLLTALLVLGLLLAGVHALPPDPTEASSITAYIDEWLLDLIDTRAPQFFNSAWNMNINQFKAWLATIAWAEGMLGGYGAHSGYGGGYYGDRFDHIAAGASFPFSTGIGPFQLDRGQTENWHLWTTLKKLNPQSAVDSTARWHRDNRGTGSTLAGFASNSPWVAVRSPADHWTAVTGTSWSAHRSGSAYLDWPAIKSQLASRAATRPHLKYSNNVVDLGSVTWNIKAGANLRTDSGRSVVFDGTYRTYLITARNWAGTQVCKYYYTYRTDGPFPIEVWVWDNSWDTTNRFRYVFARECNGQYPEGRVQGTSNAGYPRLSEPAIMIGSVRPPTAVTLYADQITETSARMWGEVTDTGGASYRARMRWRLPGGSWSYSNWTPYYTAPLPFTLTKTGLDPCTTYEFEIQAQNSAGDGWGGVKDFKTACADGALQVTIQPAGARNAGAQWRLTSGPDTTWKNSGVTVSNLPVGSYTVEFKTITGWDKPANVGVTINENQTTTLTRTYDQHVGALQVTIEPAGARTAGAQWRLTSGPDTSWKNSGATISNLPVGSYTINFKDINGWDKPANASVSIVRNQTTTLTRTYDLHVGAVRVTIEPAGARNAGAQWRLTSGHDTSWKNSGATISNLPVGSYTVTFKDITGWDKPANASVTINKDQTTTLTRTYDLHVGAVRVTIEPAGARNAGAQWRLTSGHDTSWKNSGATISNLPVASYTVTFKDITGWDKPANASVTVNKDQTTTYIGTYFEHTPDVGALQVTIEPAGARNAGAQWRLTSGPDTSWKNSGATISNLPVGSYTVEFKTITGWTKPPNVGVTINKNQTTSLTRAYDQDMPDEGSLQVNIEPAAARTAGAQWRLTSGPDTTWKNSGATISNLPVGSYTVQCKDISGWTRPADVGVDIKKNQTTTLTRTYGGPATEDWLVNLSLTTNPHIGSVPGPGLAFAFGARDGATEGYNEAEGDQIAPPDPMIGINAYFYYPNNPAHERNLVTSVVGPEPTITWPLRVKSAGDPGTTQATLTWNAGDMAGVPENYGVLELRDSGGNTLANMRTEASYTFTLPSGGTKDFRIVASEQVCFVYHLKEGWNMISLPLYTEETNPGALLPGHVVIYAWDADSLNYYVPEELVPGKGYWVLCFSDTTVTVCGAPVVEYELCGPAGWHLIGSPAMEAQATATEGNIYGLFYWWNPEALNYEATDTLEPGRGYWLLGLTEFCITIEFDQPA